jgi:hypothetical protein
VSPLYAEASTGQLFDCGPQTIFCSWSRCHAIIVYDKSKLYTNCKLCKSYNKPQKLINLDSYYHQDLFRGLKHHARSTPSENDTAASCCGSVTRVNRGIDQEAIEKAPDTRRRDDVELPVLGRC